SFVPVFAPPPSLRGFRPLRQNPVFGSFPTSWLGGSHGRTVFVAGHALEAVDFCLGSELQIQPRVQSSCHRFRIGRFHLFYSLRLASIFLACEYLHPLSSGSWVISNGFWIKHWKAKTEHAGPADIFTHILVFTSIFYTVKQLLKGLLMRTRVFIESKPLQRSRKNVSHLYSRASKT
ncbi:HXXXD-type acyl-transferase family protein, partial [Prunus dulcis]